MRNKNPDLNQFANLKDEAGGGRVEPITKKEYDLEQLLKGITRTNLHEEVDFGAPLGKEVCDLRGGKPKLWN